MLAGEVSRTPAVDGGSLRVKLSGHDGQGEAQQHKHAVTVGKLVCQAELAAHWLSQVRDAVLQYVVHGGAGGGAI